MVHCQVTNLPPEVAYSLWVANKLGYLPQDQNTTLLTVELRLI